MRLLVWLSVLGMVLSGCAGGTDGGAGFSDEGRTVIAEDQHYNTGFEATSTVTLEIGVDVHSGPNIDVIVLDDVNYRQYRRGNDFVHYESCGGVAAQGFQQSCRLDSGTYHVVLDNTNAGATAPPTNAVDDGADTSWTVSAN